MLEIAGYLDRLGLQRPRTPSYPALEAIHRAQVERIAYNTIDIQLGRPAPIEPDQVVAMIAATGRAGYCFHLNGALAALLEAVGFEVRRHRGGVWSEPNEVPLRPFANHLALTVHALPTADNPGGAWFVDAGLGDALYEPIPLRIGAVVQGGFSYTLEPSPVLAGGWRFHHDPRGTFRTMDFEMAPAAVADFALAHRYLSTSPESGFVRKLSVQRRDADGCDRLVSATLHRVDGGGTSTTEFATMPEWREQLAERFRLALDDIGADELRWLWQRVRRDQDEWNRSHDERG